MVSRAGSSSPIKLGLAMIAALLLAVPIVQAAEGEPTRAEYVARVDLICKKSEKTNSRILKGVKQQIAKKGKLVPAGNRFLRASRSFGRAVKQIARVPQPSEDAAKLGKWVRYLKVEEGLLRNIGKSLKSKKKAKANKLAVRLQRTNRRANNTVFAFEFDYCDREVNVG